MEMSDFNQSYESLNTLIQEYSELEKQLYNPPPPEPRLQILTWYTIYEHEFVLLRILVVIFVTWVLYYWELFKTRTHFTTIVDNLSTFHCRCSVLATIVVDCGIKPWMGQTKDYKTGICLQC